MAQTDICIEEGSLQDVSLLRACQRKSDHRVYIYVVVARLYLDPVVRL